MWLEDAQFDPCFLPGAVHAVHAHTCIIGLEKIGALICKAGFGGRVGGNPIPRFSDRSFPCDDAGGNRQSEE